MKKQQIAGLEAIKERISYKYAILENLRKELRRKAIALSLIEEDIKRLEKMKEWMSINTTNNSDKKE
jgi:hypothetical protein